MLKILFSLSSRLAAKQSSQLLRFAAVLVVPKVLSCISDLSGSATVNNGEEQLERLTSGFLTNF
jgi:hypothetical protein